MEQYHRRFIRWRDQGIWEALLEKLIDEPDFEWLMIDASHIKVHPQRRRRARRQRSHGPDKRGLNTKIHLAVDAHGNPVRVLITAVPRRIVRKLARLIEGMAADYLLADRGYDTNAILEQARATGDDSGHPAQKAPTGPT